MDPTFEEGKETARLTTHSTCKIESARAHCKLYFAYVWWLESWALVFSLACAYDEYQRQADSI